MTHNYTVTPAVIRRNKRAAQMHAEQQRAAKAEAGPFNEDAPLPPAADLLDVDVEAQMTAYVEMVGKPQTWPDVKVFETVKGEIHRNISAARDTAIHGRRLFTSDQVKLRDERWNKVAHDRIDIVERLIDEIPELNPEQRRLFLERVRAWRIDTMRALSAIHG